MGMALLFMAGLDLHDIHKHFGSIIAAQNVNLHLPHGRFVCFLGPSGCGKTTLLRLIAGLERPTRGRIFLEDKDITDQPAHQRHFYAIREDGVGGNAPARRARGRPGT